MTDPTPADLAERARRIGTDGGSEQDITDLIRDAEAGGHAHMTAVAEQVVNWPASGGMPSVYDTATGKPAFHETNVLIECRIKVEGQLATYREAMDPYLWAERFSDPAEFDRYLTYSLSRAFGAMMQDPRLGPLIRSKVWVVKPTDVHDFQRCAESGKANPAVWQDPGIIEPVWAPKNPAGPVPYCTEGVIIQPPGRRNLGGGVRRWSDKYEPLGTCPCRCHQHDGSCYRAEQLIRMHHHFQLNWDPTAMKFDEEQLIEDDDE